MDFVAGAAAGANLSSTIQLAIAPVFLLTAIGAFLSVMTARLGRVIDRARILEAAIPTDPVQRAIAIGDLAALDRRMVLANRAVALCVGSALFVCVLIAVLFLEAIGPLRQPQLIPGLFVVSLLLLISGLSCFALEVHVSIRTVRVRAELLREHRGFH